MNRYTLRKEPEYDTPWIAIPNNGGDVGDLSDITCELNKLLGNYEVAMDELNELRDAVRNLLNNLTYTECCGCVDCHETDDEDKLCVECEGIGYVCAAMSDNRIGPPEPCPLCSLNNDKDLARRATSLRTLNY